MSYKFLKLHVHGNTFVNYDSGGKEDMDNLSDSYMCISIDLWNINYGSRKIFEIRQKMSENNNYNCVFDSSDILVFIKKLDQDHDYDYEYKIYETLGWSNNKVIDTMTKKYWNIDEIIYPCLIMSYPERLEISGYHNVNFEYLPFNLRVVPKHGRVSMYYATKKEILVKAAVKSKKPIF